MGFNIDIIFSTSSNSYIFFHKGSQTVTEIRDYITRRKQKDIKKVLLFLGDALLYIAASIMQGTASKNTESTVDFFFFYFLLFSIQSK